MLCGSPSSLADHGAGSRRSRAPEPAAQRSCKEERGGRIREVPPPPDAYPNSWTSVNPGHSRLNRLAARLVSNTLVEATSVHAESHTASGATIHETGSPPPAMGFQAAHGSRRSCRVFEIGNSTLSLPNCQASERLRSREHG